MMVTENRVHDLFKELLEPYKDAKPLFRVRPKRWRQWLNPWWWRGAKHLEWYLNAKARQGLK